MVRFKTAHTGINTLGMQLGMDAELVAGF